MRGRLVVCLAWLGVACSKPGASDPAQAPLAPGEPSSAQVALAAPPALPPQEAGPCPGGQQLDANGLCSDPPVASAGAPGDPSPAQPMKPAPGEHLARGTGTPLDLTLAEGDRALSQDDAAGARRHYEKARRIAPKDPAPLVGLARADLRKSGIELGYAALPGDARVKRVLALLDQALALDPRFAPALLERGRVLLILGEAEPALSSLRGAAIELPNDAETQSALGVALLATGAVAEALERFQRASELDPRNPERLTNLGTAYMMRGRVSEAVRAYRQAVTLDPSDPRTHGDLGTAYLAQHDLKRAMTHLQKAVALDPRATFLSNLGYAYQLSGKSQLAISTYRRALDKDPKLGSAWINLGTVLAQLGKLDEAEKALKEAERLDPSDPRAKANLEELEALRRERAKPKGATSKGKP